MDKMERTTIGEIMTKRPNDYQHYLAGGSWKCPAAPVNPNIPLQVKHNCGAHHWKELTQSEALSGKFYCIHCFDVRQFPTNWSQLSCTNTIAEVEDATDDIGAQKL